MENKFLKLGRVKEVNATVLAPENAGLRMIVNVCAQDGKFDGKLDNLLTKRWAKVREDYKGWYAGQQNFKLGATNSTATASDIWVMSLLAKDKDGKLNETALATAVKKLGEVAKYENASAHISNLLVEEMPTLKPLLTKYLVENGVNVYFYNEPTK